MANWYGTSRSNYFAVKDLPAFEAFLKQFDAEMIKNSDGLVGFLSRTDNGDLPTRQPEDPDADPICISDEIGAHLVENHVCVVMVAGAEKLCYVTGSAIAISWTGEVVQINLEDIYATAQDEFGGDALITQAIY